jgi:hypothetical protein
VVKELCSQSKDRANRDSITTAYLLDTIQGIVSQVWGKGEYESAPGRYLPFPPPKDGEDSQDVDVPSIDTLIILFAAIKSGTVPNTVVAHLSPLLGDWKKLLKN